MPEKDLSYWCFDNAFKNVSRAMYAIQTHPLIPRNRMWFLQLFTQSIIGVSISLFFFISIFLFDVKSGSYMDAIRNFSMILICISSNMKFFTMIYYRESIAALIKYIDRDFEQAKELVQEEKNIILSYINKANVVGKIWLYVTTSTCAIFPLKAFYLMAYYYYKGEGQLVLIYDMTFPDFIEKRKSDLVPFIAVFSLFLIFDCFACLIFVCFEPLIPLFTLHACGQLELLSFKISKVVSESENEKEMKEKFKVMNIKLQELYKYIDRVQNNFMLLMEFNLKSTTVSLPSVAFFLLEEFRNGIINMEFVFLAQASFIHFLVPCYYCDLLMECSESLRQAIYSCGWENCSHISIKKTVLIMLIRTTKPLQISTVFFPINLNTFSSMCRQAYALFNLMTAAWT